MQVRAEARVLDYAERSRGCQIFKENAEIAQLVEHNLAKVRVASSSLVFRSKKVLQVRHWKGGRVVDYSGLENRRAERHRGFESLPFRRKGEQRKLFAFFLFVPSLLRLDILLGLFVYLFVSLDFIFLPFRSLKEFKLARLLFAHASVAQTLICFAA